jgi:4a-hydroxytetrahydrobiopterin dehydratase
MKGGSYMELTKLRCVPCEGGIPPFTDAQEDDYMKEVPSWTLHRSGMHMLRKHYRFADFKEAISFVNRVAEIAEQEGHHPNIHISYSTVDLELYTHAIGGLSENDFIVAAKIDSL